MRQFALALPFVLGAFGARAAVVPLGDTIARVLVSIAPIAGAPKPAPPEPAFDEPDPEPSPPAPVKAAPKRARAEPKRESPAPRAETEELADGSQGTILIPSSAVTRALEKKDVRATNAKAADGSPFGAKLHGVGKYGVGLRDGDVVTHVQGTRTRTVEAMVQTAMAAASGAPAVCGGDKTCRATRLTGTIQRGEATLAVVLEIPRQ